MRYFQQFYVHIFQQKIVTFTIFLLRRFNEINIPLIAASLTFTTLLALVPLFTIMVIVISAFPMFADQANQFNHFITSVITPAAGSELVNHYLLQFRTNASSLTAIGIIMMIVTTLLLIQTIEYAFNRIWHVPRPRPLITRMVIYWALLTLGPLIIGSSLSAWAFALKQSSSSLHSVMLMTILKTLTSVGFTTILLFLLYKIVPYRYIPYQHALLSALLTAIAFEFTRKGFGLYITNFNSYQLVYGTFAAIPVFLLWLNLLWIILLTGAVLTASFSYWQNNTYQRQNHRECFDDVLKILILLHHAQEQARAITIRVFRQKINLGYDELGDLLEKLAEHDYIAKTNDGWLLKTNADHIILADLFQLFVYQPSLHADNTASIGLQNMLKDYIKAMNISLTDFLRQANKSPRLDL